MRCQLFSDVTQVWQLQDPDGQPKVFQGWRAGVHALAIASDGYTAITGGGAHKTAMVWDLRGRTRSKPVMTIIVDDWVCDVAISPDSRFFAVGLQGNSVELRSIQTGDLLQQFTGHNRAVRSVEFSPDGRTIISASVDASILTWEIDPVDPQKCVSSQPSKQMKLHRVGS
jgi:general transcriptional corepressor TUP1